MDWKGVIVGIGVGFSLLFAIYGGFAVSKAYQVYKEISWVTQTVGVDDKGNEVKAGAVLVMIAQDRLQRLAKDNNVDIQEHPGSGSKSP